MVTEQAAIAARRDLLGDGRSDGRAPRAVEAGAERTAGGGRAGEDEVHLANLDEDMGERGNLAAEQPELAADLAPRRKWHAGIEARWADEFAPRTNGTTGAPSE